ncbi:hypothetical protein AMTR_s00062p00092630 [Amborella trichopoda]|uniref:Uncharacterized protein n=1 Tax=Amborella trichopoda TaxID=13333 RepID=U5DDS6_AMBTC|nr:hypothetical protein AMTR_s00062p00092630 [Amborella trichopoda]
MEKLGNPHFRFPKSEAAERDGKSEGKRRYVIYREEREMESGNKVAEVEAEAVIDHRQLLMRHGGLLIEEWRFANPKPPRVGGAVISSPEKLNARHFVRKNQKPWF